MNELIVDKFKDEEKIAGHGKHDIYCILHLTQSDILKHADDIIAGINVENTYAGEHIGRCIDCKTQVLELLHFYNSENIL